MPSAPLALPERHRQPAHQPRLELAFGADLDEEPAGEPFEFLRVFLVEDQVVQGGEAVLQRVARGAGLALGGHGAARAGAVAAGGFDLCRGARTWRGKGGGGHGSVFRRRNSPLAYHDPE
jgi:hypothetical protein